jgi:hypothetical protein
MQGFTLGFHFLLSCSYFWGFIHPANKSFFGHIDCFSFVGFDLFGILPLRRYAMQMLLSPEAILKKRDESKSISRFADNSYRTTQSEFPLSFDSQLTLEPLSEYVNHCRSVLNDIHTDFAQLEMDPGNLSILSKVSERLGGFCLDADSWGFHSLYDVALGLQKRLLESGGRVRSIRLKDSLNRGLTMLSAMIDQCETDFHRSLVVDEVLECLT